MTKKTGLRFEHDVKNEINDATTNDVRAWRPGWSGNGKGDSCDVLITTPTQCYAIELKKTGVKKGFAIEDDDVQQLYDCQNSYIDGWFGVKFNHRELCLFKLPYIHSEDTMMGAVANEVPVELNPRIGHTSNSLLIDKPDLDSWESASAGRQDVEMIINTLGLDPYASASQTIVEDSDSSFGTEQQTVTA